MIRHDENSQIVLSDFPKVHCPFIRQTFAVNREQWKSHGSRLHLREPEAYLVVDRVNPGYEWVFEDPNTIAVEKLDGTNVKIYTEKGRLLHVQNRKNFVDPLQIIKGPSAIVEGILNAVGKGYVKLDGEQAGEVIGPKLQGNPYKLDLHLWYPFEQTIANLRYKSFEEHDRTFNNWSSWFQNNLFSRLYTKRATKLGLTDKVFAEGVIFYNFKRRDTGQTWMAKLRRDMFPWYYSEHIEILDYKQAGRDTNEDQERFD